MLKPLGAALLAATLVVTPVHAVGGAPATASSTPSATPSAAALAQATRTKTTTRTKAPTTAKATLSRAAPGGLDWEHCEQGRLCATVPVPLDHDRPTGPTITLRVIRLPVPDPAAKVGSLYVNPGGPGTSAYDYVAGPGVLGLPAGVLRAFDIVAVEPRGLPRSAPVRCDGSALAGTTVQAATAAAYARSCGARSGALLPYIDSDSVARDLEVVRRRTGEATLSYLGYSYGSLPGLAYLHRYPERVRAMVLDAPVDPSVRGSLGLVEHLAALERALAAFLDACGRATAETPCPLLDAARAAGDRDVAAAYARILRRFARGPIPGAAGRPAISRATFDTVVVTLLADGNFRSLARVLADTAEGSTLWLTSAVATLGIDATSFRPAGDPQFGAFEAYLCRDGSDPSAAGGAKVTAADLTRVAPHFAGYGALRAASDRCRAWPVPARAPIAVTTRTAPAGGVVPPVLVVATTFDVRTPIGWATHVVGVLGAGAQLVRFDAAGHTIVGQGSTCVDAAVERVLLRGDLPTTPLAC